jgi:multidrug efflux pump
MSPRFEIDGEQYDVTVALPLEERTSPDVLSRIYVRGTGGTMVQLSSLVSHVARPWRHVS